MSIPTVINAAGRAVMTERTKPAIPFRVSENTGLQETGTVHQYRRVPTFRLMETRL